VWAHAEPEAVLNDRDFVHGRTPDRARSRLITCLRGARAPRVDLDVHRLKRGQRPSKTGVTFLEQAS
jgi:hypothetical protein